MKGQPIKTVFSRDEQVKKLAEDSTTWDVLVIGGGATGLGVALDAMARGYKTLLVEQADFAKGTSSRSTKLVHGGVRYLAQGNIKLVREACIERGLLFRNAPHLVKNQTFIIPVYTVWDRLKYAIGLKVYDWIAGGLSLGSSQALSKQKTIEALPGVQTKGLLGGIMYHDGQFDDSRLAINLVQSILEKGGCAINYVRITGLLKNKEGKLEVAAVTDAETGIAYTVKAKALVNATGVFVDEILKMDNAALPKTICVSQGVHVVLDKKFFPSSHALMIPQTSDGRVLFAVPWHNKVVIGTTDTPTDHASLEPQASEREIDFILKTAGGFLTSPPSRKDVLSVFAGLRPLAAPTLGSKTTKEISRSHKIIVSDANLFTMLGGKWTTFRKMGEDMINRVEKELNWPRRLPATSGVPIHGYVAKVDISDPFHFYGSDAEALRQLMKANESGWISESLKIHEAQIHLAVTQEMTRTVEDFLSRRTRALLLDAKESICNCPQVAKVMAALLGKGEKWMEEQIANYTMVASRYVLEQQLKEHNPEAESVISKIAK